ncbi:MAG: hypothetical protein JXR77_15285 [Lentisphaeria bacterium]|nr:hypothetical protein [Lentisphaeria bacterium]
MTAPGVIIIDPILPVWVLALVIFAVAYGAWRTYRACALTGRQRWVLWALRLSAVLILAWLMLQARRRTVRVEEELPVLAVAVDVSASMVDNPGKARQTRRDRAIEFLSSGRVRDLEGRYRVVRYAIGAELEEGVADPADIRFNAPRTHLGTGLNRIVDRLRAENLAAILLLSDGLDQSGERLTPQSLRVPVFIPELEDPFDPETRVETDYWVAEISHPKMMAVHWKAGIDALVRRHDRGATAFPIHLKQNGTIVRSSMVTFAEEETFRQVTFSVEPVEVGQILYRIEIAPEVDLQDGNNARDFLIEVTDPKNKVLYLEGVPRWEFKFLKRALLSEKNYQLSAYVRGGDGSFINFDEIRGQAGGDVPALTTEGLSAYRVVVLGDMEGSALTEDDCRNVRDFVDKGGGMLLVGAGKAYGPQGFGSVSYLGDLLPAVSEAGAGMREGRFTVDITPMGRTHPALGELPLESLLPPLLSFWAPVRVGQFSSVLIAAADGSPVVVVRRFGQGRVAMLLSDSLWRWQLGGMDGGADKSLYNRFVTQLVHWLAPSAKDVEKSALLQIVTAGSQVELREKVTIGAVYDAVEGASALTCRIATPGGQTLSFPMLGATLGRDVGLSRTVDGFRCTFTPDEPGTYDVAVSSSDGTQSATMKLLAEEPELEQTGEPIQRAYLSELAQETGGQLVAWEERNRILRELPHSTQEFTRTLETSVWNRWWWIGVLIGLFCVEWWWRRKLDLV